MYHYCTCKEKCSNIVQTFITLVYVLYFGVFDDLTNYRKIRPG